LPYPDIQLSCISLYFRNVKNPHYTENMLSCGLNVLLDRFGHSTVEIVCFFIMSGPKPQHPESCVPFPPSSEPCHSAPQIFWTNFSTTRCNTICGTMLNYVTKDPNI
jgi:hypothetical protein